MKIKMHHVLLAIFGLFITGMISSAVLKSFIKESIRIKSEVDDLELLKMVEPKAILYTQNINSDLKIEDLESADFYFFKNKRELIIHLKSHSNDIIYKTEFLNLSPGFGLREKLSQLTPAEGIYSILYSGYLNKGGLFVRVNYPPEKFNEYQKMDFENLSLDPYVISEKPITNSFIQADKSLMEFLTFLTLKLNKNKIRLLIYPDTPPLAMEIGGTEFVSEIYRDLEQEYTKLNEIMELKKSAL